MGLERPEHCCKCRRCRGTNPSRHCERPARLQHTPDFGQCFGLVSDVHHSEIADDFVELCVLEWHRCCVTLDNVGGRRCHSCSRNHLGGEIKPGHPCPFFAMDAVRVPWPQHKSRTSSSEDICLATISLPTASVMGTKCLKYASTIPPSDQPSCSRRPNSENSGMVQLSLQANHNIARCSPPHVEKKAPRPLPPRARC